MEFIDQIKTIAQRIEKFKGKITNEEATKNSFIMPFIEALGYIVVLTNFRTISIICSGYWGLGTRD